VVHADGARRPDPSVEREPQPEPAELVGAELVVRGARPTAGHDGWLTLAWQLGVVDWDGYEFPEGCLEATGRILVEEDDRSERAVALDRELDGPWQDDVTIWAVVDVATEEETDAVASRIADSITSLSGAGVVWRVDRRLPQDTDSSISLWAKTDGDA